MSMYGKLPTWIIPPSVFKELELDSLARYPQEACGVLLGEIKAGTAVINEYVPLHNASGQPERHFALEPKEWVRYCYHPRLLGLYHSHPSAPPQPSRTDLAELPLFAGLLHLYAIGSCCPKATLENLPKPSASAAAFMIQGYNVIRDPQGAAALIEAELAPSIAEKRS